MFFPLPIMGQYPWLGTPERFGAFFFICHKLSSRARCRPFPNQHNNATLEMAEVEEVVAVETEKQPTEIVSQRAPTTEEKVTTLLELDNTETAEVKIMVNSLEELSAVEGDGQTINEDEYGEWHPLVDMSSTSLFNASEIEDCSEQPSLSLKLPRENSTSSINRDNHSSTFMEMEFESEEMKKFLAYQQKTQPKYTSIEDMMYKPQELFPDW